MALINDRGFKKYVDLYAKDEEKFFSDFAAAFSKLQSLGVEFPVDSKSIRFKTQ
jgi:cytochrome c peroxidase